MIPTKKKFLISYSDQHSTAVGYRGVLSTKSALSGRSQSWDQYVNPSTRDLLSDSFMRRSDALRYRSSSYNHAINLSHPRQPYMQRHPPSAFIQDCEVRSMLKTW